MSLKQTMENLKTCKLCDVPNSPHYGGTSTKDGFRNPCKECIRKIDAKKRPYRGLMKIGRNDFPTLKQMIKERQTTL